MSAARSQQLVSTVQVLKTDVGVLRTDVAVLKADVAVLKTDVAELKVGLADTRSEMRTLFESSNAEIRVVAEGQIALGERMERGFADMRALMVEMVAPIRATLQHHSRVLDDHERRLSS